jgi:ERCC4-type nuclease
MAHIFIDNREKTEDRASPRIYLPAAIDANNAKYKEKITSSVVNLKLGDYAIMIQEKLAIVFERKTWKDLASSISDNRAKTQGARLLELAKTGVRCYFLIEGNAYNADNKQIHGIPCKNLYAKLRRNMIRGLPYVMAPDMNGSAKLLVDFARDLINMIREGELNVDRLSGDVFEPVVTWNNVDWDEDWAMNAMQGDQVVEIKFGKDELAVPKELNKVVTLSDADVQQALWQCFPKIGQTRATKLCAANAKVGDLWRSEYLKSWRDGLSNIVSKEYATELMLMIKAAALPRSERDLPTQQKIDGTSLQVLQAIPGMGEVQSRLVLSKCTLVEIARGKRTAAEMAEWKNEKNRRLGPALAEKIVKFLGPQTGCPYLSATPSK